MLDKPTSIGMIAFAPYVMEKGVSPVDLKENLVLYPIQNS